MFYLKLGIFVLGAPCKYEPLLKLWPGRKGFENCHSAGLCNAVSYLGNARLSNETLVDKTVENQIL
jgi:hypothetical protein